MCAAVCRPIMFLLLFVCFSFSALSVNGRAAKDSIIFPDAVYGRFNQRIAVSNSQEVLRPLRQINRRPTGNNRQTNGEDEDIFSGIDTDWVNNNNGQQNSGNRPNGQWSNNGNQNQGSGNRPNGQWSNNGNQGSSQGFGNRPNGQSSNNGNQNQGSGNRPNGQWPNNNNQNQGGSSNSNSQNESQQSSSSSQVGQPDRDACNARCRERVTGEYNPVCGTDAMTYQNRRFLECISDCGIQTNLSYNGKCITTTERVAVR
ncbi:insoluble matrix shell protein 4-like isoform X2 [Adelges cooleyi]|uniref:insoluble matrix shell protein 4-like isoform X2 n=1 Tax=Adelges cooleyi TaxID=133065 RepID=UPI0021805DDF|nr:insoluble matrix shell protein 4-like isoform X2 [Adelges cooleyi]